MCTCGFNVLGVGGAAFVVKESRWVKVRKRLQEVDGVIESDGVCLTQFQAKWLY